MQKIKTWLTFAAIGFLGYLMLVFRSRTKKLRALQFKMRTAHYSKELDAVKTLIKKRSEESAELSKKLKIATSAYMQSSKRLRDSSSK